MIRKTDFSSWESRRTNTAKTTVSKWQTVRMAVEGCTSTVVHPNCTRSVVHSHKSHTTATNPRYTCKTTLGFFYWGFFVWSRLRVFLLPDFPYESSTGVFLVEFPVRGPNAGFFSGERLVWIIERLRRAGRKSGIIESTGWAGQNGTVRVKWLDSKFHDYNNLLSSRSLLHSTVMAQSVQGWKEPYTVSGSGYSRGIPDWVREGMIRSKVGPSISCVSVTSG